MSQAPNDLSKMTQLAADIRTQMFCSTLSPLPLCYLCLGSPGSFQGCLSIRDLIILCREWKRRYSSPHRCYWWGSSISGLGLDYWSSLHSLEHMPLPVTCCAAFGTRVFCDWGKKKGGYSHYVAPRLTTVSHRTEGQLTWGHTSNERRCWDSELGPFGVLFFKISYNGTDRS